MYLIAARTVDMDGFSLPWGPLSATHNAAICRSKIPVSDGDACAGIWQRRPGRLGNKGWS